MTTVEERSEPKAGYKIVGSRPIRHDGVDKVTGRAQYGADIQLPGTLHGKILRSRTATPASSPSTPARPRPCPR